MAQANNVVHLPRPDFTFHPVNFRKHAMIEKYKQHTLAVGMCQKFLEMTVPDMKVAVAKIAAGSDCGTPADLIETFTDISKDFIALSEMFDTAAARVTSVHAKLV